MTAASDNVFTRLLISEGGSTTTPASGNVTVYAKADGLLYSKDDAGAETALGGGGAGADAFFTPAIFSVGYSPETTGTNNFVGDAAYLQFVYLPHQIKLRNFGFRMSAAASGTFTVGLFDYATDATACTLVADASGALNSTGRVVIAATGAPVTVPAGNYALIVKAPATNAGTGYRTDMAVDHKLSATATGYTWDTTPDLTTGWTASQFVRAFWLEGDLNATSTW